MNSKENAGRLRSQTLKRLGLIQWYSRFDLPGAAKTPDVLLAVTSDSGEQVSVKNAEFRSIAVARDAKRADDISADKVSKGDSQIINTEKDVRVDPGIPIVLPQKDGQLSLSLALQASRTVLILSESHDGVDIALENDLLVSILKFIDTGKFGIVDVERMVWPVFSSSAMRMHQSAYYESALSLWLSKKHWREIKYVLYLGKSFSELESCLVSMAKEYESDCAFISLSVSGAELLGMPVKKRLLWEAISGLSQK